MRSFILFGLLATIGFGAVEASAQGQTLRADIPFEFTVGKKTLPAGEYRITLPATGSAPQVVFKSVNGEALSMAMTNWVKAAKATAGEGQLVFVKTGDRHVLYQVFDGREIGQELVSAKKLARTDLATKTIVLKPTRT